MAHRSKTIFYEDGERNILLQNENGPCPLLAAANVLLLRGVMELPRKSVGENSISTEHVLQLLANHALSTNSNDNHWHMEELLNTLSKFQYGMDVNPKFTAGVTGVEYTQNMSAFDLLRIPMLHGWLLDPTSEQKLTSIVQGKTYNECVDHFFVHPQHSSATPSTDTASASISITNDTAAQEDALLVQEFIHSSSTQLTQYGLEALHEYMKDGQLVILFRNNHFSTMTKHDNQLYVLVTDSGYANYPHVVWETFHDISGDTHYTNSYFVQDDAPTINTHATTNDENADFQLALQLSAAATISTPTPKTNKNNTDSADPFSPNFTSDIVTDSNENDDLRIALQLQQRLDEERKSETLARTLQRQEDQYHLLQQQQRKKQQQQQQQQQQSSAASEKSSSCIIS